MSDRPTARDAGETGGPDRPLESDSPAARIVLSYPSDLSDWGRFQVEKPSFRAYLRKTRTTAHEGDRWEEFVGVGCCGNSLDVPLRVERVEGGRAVGPDTAFEYEVRDTCEVDGFWAVQDANQR